MIHHGRIDTDLGESVVDEVRAIREALDREFGHDVERLAEAARRRSEEVRREFGMRSVDAQSSDRQD